MSETLDAVREADVTTIGQMIMMSRGARVMTTAVTLGIFDALGDDAHASDELATKLKTDPRATEILLDALVSLGLARKGEGKYANTDTGRMYLSSTGSRSLARNFRYQEMLAGAWANLPDIVRTGKSTFSLLDLLIGQPQFTQEYILGMADISRPPAAQLAQSLDLSGVRDALDVGGGPAVYARALCEAAPQLNVTLLDLDVTLAIARKLLADSPAGSRITLRPGNYHEADFGENAFDLVLFSHVTHDEGEQANQALLAKAYRALRPGGQVVIHDFMVNHDRTGPAFPALFSVHMLTYTRQGRSYSADEYRQWILGCGFKEPAQIEICADSPTATSALIACKP